MSKAQELATLLEKMKSEGWSTQNEDQAAALIREQDALLRQALEAMNCSHRDANKHDRMYAAAKAIKEHLE